VEVEQHYGKNGSGTHSALYSEHSWFFLNSGLRGAVYLWIPRDFCVVKPYSIYLCTWFPFAGVESCPGDGTTWSEWDSPTVNPLEYNWDIFPGCSNFFHVRIRKVVIFPCIDRVGEQFDTDLLSVRQMVLFQSIWAKSHIKEVRCMCDFFFFIKWPKIGLGA
jgi:hypothetical protein